MVVPTLKHGSYGVEPALQAHASVRNHAAFDGILQKPVTGSSSSCVGGVKWTTVVSVAGKP